MTLDDVCEKYGDERGNLDLRLLKEDDGSPSSTVLVEGSPRSLLLLAELLSAVALDEKEEGFSISPFGAGKFHFSEKSELGVYINCVR